MIEFSNFAHPKELGVPQLFTMGVEGPHAKPKRNKKR